MHPDFLLFVGGGEMMIIFMMLIPFIFIGWAFIDVLRSEFRSQSTKALWIIAILVFPFIGALIYAVLGRSQRVNY